MEAKMFEGEKKFLFYTYDRNGNDVVIDINAETQKDAWAKFDRIYGTNIPVDLVKESV